MSHQAFSPSLPFLPAAPSNATALRALIDNPQSPLNTAITGGFPFDEVIKGWLIPSLERVVDEKKVGEMVDEWLWVEGTRAKRIVVVWVLATYFTTTEIKPETHTAHMVQLADNLIRTVDHSDLRIPGIVAKAGDLAKGLLAVAKLHALVNHMLQPLWILLHKIRLSPGCLTAVHAVFVEACLLTRNLDTALPLVEMKITDLTSSPLKYKDYLGYHYLAGQVYIGLRRWNEAREMLRIVVCAPGTSVSAIQIAAHKKAVLVGLVLDGSEPTYPRFVPNQLLAAFTTHAGDYAELARAYAAMDETRLGDIMRRVDGFRRDNNYGLLVAVYEAIPARKIIRMRDTYVRIDIGKLATRISGPFNDVSPDEAEQLVLQLVTQGDLFAKITHPTDGSATVEFTDDPSLYNSSQTIDELGVLAMRMQGMGATLAGLEQSLSTHESWLKEVVRREEKRLDVGGKMGEPTAAGEKNVRGVGSNWADAGF